MQLTANGAHMVVDFYPVKYSDGTISERLMYKTVTFCNKMQSKSYINKCMFEKEVAIYWKKSEFSANCKPIIAGKNIKAWAKIIGITPDAFNFKGKNCLEPEIFFS